MQPPFSCPTVQWHNDTYDAISPLRPDITAAGKKIVVTGAAGVIGIEIARAFAEAGASHIYLVGHNQFSFEDKATLIPQVAQIELADASSEEAMKSVAACVGVWDVLILNAGYAPESTPVADVKIEDLQKCFNVNTFSIVAAARAFIPHARKDRAVILATTCDASPFSPTRAPGQSLYLMSKMAQVKLMEYLAAENKHIFIACVHPGMVNSPIYRASGLKLKPEAMNSPILSAHFMVWMASDEAKDLRGKTVWANWDVKELKELASECKDSTDFTLGVLCWPFSDLSA